MVCVYCGKDTEVANSRAAKKSPSVWRRRRCENCESIFSTREKPDLSLSIKVQNHSGDFEPFSEDKLFLSIKDSLSHRKSSLSASRQLSDTVVSKLMPKMHGQITRQEIISTTYPIIRRFDRPAATYYKSHHPTNTQT